MNIRELAWPLLLLFGITLLGCEPPAPVATNPAVPPAPPGSAPSPPPPPPATPLPPETKVGVFAGTLDDLAARPASPPSAPTGPESSLPAPDEGTERVKAEKGVGIKGRSLDQYEGVVVTPVKSFFAAKERIVFEIQFPHAYQLYKAMENSVPKDFDELKAKVIDPNQFALPQLPPGHKYVWDAGKEELLVERPKK